jgi:hypothetical protein
MAQRIRLRLPVLDQALVRIPAKFVALARQLRLGAARVIAATLQHEHVDALIRQLTRDQPGTKTTAHDNHRALRKHVRHGSLRA